MEEHSCVLRETDRQVIWVWCSSVWMWGSKIDFEYLNTHVPLFPFLIHDLSTPMLAERLCGTHIEMPAMIHRGMSLPAAVLRSPNSGVKLPLLVSPLISYGNDAFRPCTCCPHAKLHQEHRHGSLWSIFFPCCCSEHPSTSPITTWFPTASVH